MRILVTNDDGIFSPGLLALAEAASLFGDVTVVAPDVERSAMGHAITIWRPLTWKKARVGDFEAYRVNGTPADCTALGLYRWGGAELVLSGINLGANLGHDVWHSGTVAAARQAVFFGVPAVAFSLDINGEEPDFAAQKPTEDKVLHLLLEEGALRDVESGHPALINVNLPRHPKGMRWTHQSVRSYSGKVIEGEDPRGRKHFWFSAVPLTGPDEGSDRWAVENDLVALTPLRIKLTDDEVLKRKLG